MGATQTTEWSLRLWQECKCLQGHSRYSTAKSCRRQTSNCYFTLQLWWRKGVMMKVSHPSNGAGSFLLPWLLQPQSLCLIAIPVLGLVRRCSPESVDVIDAAMATPQTGSSSRHGEVAYSIPSLSASSRSHLHTIGTSAVRHSHQAQAPKMLAFGTRANAVDSKSIPPCLGIA